MGIPRRLVIIGNGYDLHCGLKTNCVDFQNYLVAEDKKFLTSNLFALLFNELYINKNYYRNVFDSCSHYRTPIFTYDECDDIRKSIGEAKWMDIEKFLMEFIIGAGYTKLYNDLKITFESYDPLKPVYNKNCVVEKALFELLLKTFSKYKDEKPLFIDYIYRELIEYEVNFASYLRKIDNNCGKEKKTLMYKIVGEKEGINEVLKSSIICFNYTSFYKAAGYPNCYVHGTISRTDIFQRFNVSPIIIGIDYESIIKSNFERKDEAKKFSKTYRKLKLEETTSKNDFKMPDRKYLNKIIFYGHSLGAQDYSYFQTIFDYYNIYESNVILEFCYSTYSYVNEFGENVQKTVSQVENELNESVFELINKYGQTFDNKDHGSNLLHKLLLENRIKLRHIE